MATKDQPAAQRISAAWQRVRRWLEAEAPEAASLLRPGAKEDEIRAMESALGQTLPDGWAQLWRENNGQQFADREPGVLAGWWFLPTAQIVTEWKGWEEIRSRATHSLLYGGSHVSKPRDAIEEVYTDTGWIPVAREPWEGNYVGMDFHPGPAGKPGQIINFGRDEEEKHVLAAGLPEVLETIAREFAAGHVVVYRSNGRITLGSKDEEERLPGFLRAARDREVE